MEAAIELLSMLWKSNASFQLYSKIVKWAEHFFLGAIHEKLPSRDCVLQTLSTHYYLDCLKPFKNLCVLPTTNLEFDVITHDFISSVFSLLTDESLMQKENLIFDDWQKPAAAFTLNLDGVFGELNSGSAYKEFVGKIMIQKIL